MSEQIVALKTGDRVKTDRRDAIKLARCFRAGELTKVWVPDLAHEALRDLVRAREAAKKDQLRARHRISKFLLRAGRRPDDDTKAWSHAYVLWLRGVQFEHPARQATMVDYLGELDHVAARIRRLEQAIDDAIQAAPPLLRELVAGLQALRGIAKLTATTIAIEVGNFTRFEKPKQLMGYAGITPSEYSTGSSRQQGAITKTGRPRKIPLNSRVARLFRALEAKADGDYIFRARGTRDRPIGTYNAVWDRVMETLELDYTFYNLRDTFITNALRRGLSSVFVGKYTDTSSTMIDRKYAVPEESIMEAVAS
jgi:transposase